MKKNKEEYQLLMYVEDCSPKFKKFKTKAEMGKFVEKFQKKYPNHLAIDSGYWIDFCIFGVTGDICFFTDGITLE